MTDEQRSVFWVRFNGELEAELRGAGVDDEREIVRWIVQFHDDVVAYMNRVRTPSGAA